MQKVRWAILREDGELQRGEGSPPGLNSELLPKSIASVLLLPGFKPVFVSGPISLVWRNDIVANASTGETIRADRFWGLQVEPPNRVWFWPNGSLIGVGESVEAVEASVSVLQKYLGLPLARA